MNDYFDDKWDLWSNENDMFVIILRFLNWNTIYLLPLTNGNSEFPKEGDRRKVLDPGKFPSFVSLKDNDNVDKDWGL